MLLKKYLPLTFILFLIEAVPCGAQTMRKDTIEREVYGVIASRTGNNVKIVLDDNNQNLPQTGMHGELLKHIDTKLFGTSVTAWMSIGDMKVSTIAGKNLTLLLEKEKSVITENGVKKDHFTPQQQVKFTWKELVSLDEVFYTRALQDLEKDNDSASYHLKKALKFNPKHADAWNMLGVIKNDKEDYDSAAYYFKKAYQIDTASEKYLKNLVLSDIRIKQYNDAYRYALKTVAISPDDPESYYLRAFSYLYCHQATLNAEDRKVVLADMAKAIALNPENPFYYGERMFIENSFSDIDAACLDAKKYKDLGGKNAGVYIVRFCK